MLFRSGEGVFAWETQTEPSSYETKLNVVFTPSDTEKYDYTQNAGWNAENKTVVREVKVLVEELKEDLGTPEIPETEAPEVVPPTELETETPETPEIPETEVPEIPNGPETSLPTEPETETPEAPEVPETEMPEKDDVQIEYIDLEQPAEPEVEEEKEEVVYQAEEGQTGEIAQEVPEALPVGSLIDETGVQVSGDFIPYYVDLQDRKSVV